MDGPLRRAIQLERDRVRPDHEPGRVTPVRDRQHRQPAGWDWATVAYDLTTVEGLFGALRDLVTSYADSGEVTRTDKRWLLAKLRMAEQHWQQGQNQRAIQRLEGFQSLAKNPKLVTSQAARDALVEEADRLIAKLKK